MATTIGPLLSIGARGQIGKAIVYSDWKGINTAKKYTIPANPKTTLQEKNRDLFTWCHDAFKYLPQNVQAPWNEYVKGVALTPMNAWQQANQIALKGATNLSMIVFTKPVRSGPPAATITATPGSGSVTIVGTVAPLIAGWTATNMVAIAMQDVTPSGQLEQIISSSGEVSSSPYTVTISGLLHAQAYRCGCFFQYLRPDAQVAYGGSITALATTT